MVVKNVAEVVESVTGKIDDNITKTCTLLNEEEIGGAINDAFQDAFQGGLFGSTETADPFEKPAESVNHMDDDDDNDEASAPAMSAWTQTTKAIFSGFFGGDGISRAFEGLGMDDTEDPFETSAENANDMDDDDYYDAEEEVSGWERANTTKTDAPFETPADDAKETPAASIWTKMVTAGC